MSDNLFASFIAKKVIAYIIQNKGYESIEQSALEVLIEIMERYIEKLGRETKIITELGKRTKSNFNDVQFALLKFKTSTPDLEDFVCQTNQPIFDQKIQSFPIPQSSYKSKKPKPISNYKRNQEENNFKMDEEENRSNMIDNGLFDRIITSNDENILQNDENNENQLENDENNENQLENDENNENQLENDLDSKPKLILPFTLPDFPNQNHLSEDFIKNDLNENLTENLNSNLNQNEIQNFLDPIDKILLDITTQQELLRKTEKKKTHEALQLRQNYFKNSNDLNYGNDLKF
ncbi:transcription initiation factor tfiid subunit 3 [Anaeramoeba ignava]|uniref:Transcription initiation factor tfiid subunit 3 n=1 Tax=Anaeramoeba ignava TaxID=1746090 RepID=A0A9Q0RFI0_ANAIG|nr:transcription initiation factor tfiid subunit 3 [Anaeramoeba ignava]